VPTCGRTIKLEDNCHDPTACTRTRRQNTERDIFTYGDDHIRARENRAPDCTIPDSELEAALEDCLRAVNRGSFPDGVLDFAATETEEASVIYVVARRHGPYVVSRAAHDTNFPQVALGIKMPRLNQLLLAGGEAEAAEVDLAVQEAAESLCSARVPRDGGSTLFGTNDAGYHARWIPLRLLVACCVAEVLFVLCVQTGFRRGTGGVVRPSDAAAPITRAAKTPLQWLEQRGLASLNLLCFSVVLCMEIKALG
jgi:hypothetical protein